MIEDEFQVPDQTNFDAQLKQWLVKQGVAVELRMLIVDVKEISLYDLYIEVLKEGGGNAVTQRNLWPVIGANIGFVQFPANGTEPAKSSPQLANHLMNLHKTYLCTWENAFISRILQQWGRQAAARAHGSPPPIVGAFQQQPVDTTHTMQPTLGGAPGPVSRVPTSQQNAVGQFTRPTLQQMNSATAFIRRTEEEYSNTRRSFNPVQISEHEKGAYMQQFDHLWRFVQEVEKKLVMYHALFNDEQSAIKLVAILVTTKEQRKLLEIPAAPPQYILGIQIVQSLLVELQEMMDRFYKAISTMAPNPPTPKEYAISPQQSNPEFK